MSTQKKVSILIPNYKTPELTKLCLRLLRKYTPLHLAEVIVIDNQSDDALIIEYCRSLSWIKLIERQTTPGESGPEAHVRALDCGLAMATAPYILSIHTDTFVRRPDWLNYLIQKIEANDKIAGVGSWKLEEKNCLQVGIKNLIDTYREKLGFKQPEERYLRSHCALYKRNILNQYQLCFTQGSSTAGQWIHQQLVAEGYHMQFLQEQELVKYLVHANHATMVLNPKLGAGQRTISRGLKRIEETLKSLGAKQVLEDESLDR